jgi:hypothetical protein
MTDKQTTIVIKGRVGYEDEITIAQAAQIITFLNAADGEKASLGSGLRGDALRGEQSSTSTGGKSRKAVESARDALVLSGAKTKPEKIVALGAYVLQDGGETFKVEDVKAQFRRARETAPTNFTRDMSAAVQAGWIAQDENDEYYITNKIQGLFDGDFKFPKVGTGGKTKSTKAKAEKPEVFAAIDEFPTQLNGFPPYSKMKSNKDRILWALQFAKTNGIQGLTNKDVGWVTDHLGPGVPNGQITGAFNGAKAAGYANRSTQDKTIRITPDGVTYLATVGASEA